MTGYVSFQEGYMFWWAFCNLEGHHFFCIVARLYVTPQTDLHCYFWGFVSCYAYVCLLESTSAPKSLNWRHPLQPNNFKILQKPISLAILFFPCFFTFTSKANLFETCWYKLFHSHGPRFYPCLPPGCTSWTFTLTAFWTQTLSYSDTLLAYKN